MDLDQSKLDLGFQLLALHHDFQREVHSKQWHPLGLLCTQLACVHLLEVHLLLHYQV